MERPHRPEARNRRRWRSLALTAGLLAVGLAGLGWLLRGGGASPALVRVGVVHALTGVMAESERPLVDALRLAADDINARGGVLGRPVALVVVDSRSDPAVAAREAERLIREEGVHALFGCWTSACRKAVIPVVEREHHLWFYPLQYEGLEQSPNVIYLGAAPNQQILPGTRWAVGQFGPRVYLVGSDYVFPRIANRLIREFLAATGGTVVAERYRPLDSADFGAVAREIAALRPDVVLNTVNGAGNGPLFEALQGALAEPVPVVSFSVAEPELRVLGAARAYPAHYAVWGYFQSLDTPENRRHVARHRARYGADQPLSDPVVTSHAALSLWASAVRSIGSAEPAAVNREVRRVSLAGPLGVVALDAATGHLWRRVFVGHAQPDGQFSVRELSESPVRPAPFPPYHSRDDWLRMVRDPSLSGAATGGAR